MGNKNEFTSLFNRELDKLDLYTKAITRAHGDSHPEAFDVRKVFETIKEKVEKNEEANLASDFTDLRKITDNYQVPNDVCETYEAVYRMLATLDKAYEA